MKKILFICLLSIGVTARLSAQNLPHFEQVKLQKRKDFKLADSVVLQTSNYLLSIPINQDSIQRLRSAHFLMKWMDGTDDYTFTLDENSTQYFISDINLMAVYVAALSKTALQHKPGYDSKKITLSAIKLLLDYASNSNNNVHHTSGLDELYDADRKGHLESFLYP